MSQDDEHFTVATSLQSDPGPYKDILRYASPEYMMPDPFVDPLQQSDEEYLTRIRKFLDVWPRGKPLPPIVINVNPTWKSSTNK